jgi:hypothetical protein
MAPAIQVQSVPTRSTPTPIPRNARILSLLVVLQALHSGRSAKV